MLVNHNYIIYSCENFKKKFQIFTSTKNSVESVIFQFRGF